MLLLLLGRLAAGFLGPLVVVLLLGGAGARGSLSAGHAEFVLFL
jgi:hypothetical protein